MMDIEDYSRLRNSKFWTLDALHEAYIEVGGENPDQWARRARNRCIDDHRRTKRHAMLSLDAVSVMPARERPQLDECIDNETALLLRDLVSSLPPRLRQVTEMRFFRGLTPSEISDHLRVSHNTVYTWLRRAIAELRGKPSLRRLGPDNHEWKGQ